MKFVLFLVCAIVAVQGYSVHPVEKAPTKDLGDVIQIIQIIREVIERINQIIAEIQQNLPELINSIRDKINEIVAQVPEIIKEILDRIQAIVGEGAIQCIEAQREQIEILVQQITEGINECAQESEGQVDALNKELEALIATAESVSRDIISRVTTCVRDHQNPIAIAICLSRQVEAIREELKELEERIAAAWDVAQDTSVVWFECVAKVSAQISTKEQAIINDIKQCIQQNQL